jgi:membrane associated rhomboid family serine protease
VLTLGHEQERAIDPMGAVQTDPWCDDHHGDHSCVVGGLSDVWVGNQGHHPALDGANTGPLIEISFLSLVMQAFVIWSFIPTMEEHWGTSRLLRFALLTSVAGTVGGTLVGLVLSRDVAILGVDPFIYSTIVAFGVLRGKEQVRFFGAATMTGRQMMLGILAFLFLFVVLQQRWEDGGAFAAAVGMAVLLTSRKYNPRVLWKRWQIRRSRAHLSVVPPSKPRKSDERWIN